MKYFRLDEFACRCGCKRNNMDERFLEELDQLRTIYGKPLIVSSGYRCPDHNAKVSSTGRTGPHTTGHACDFAVSGGDSLLLLRVALVLDFTGIGINQKGAGRFIHVDDLPNRAGQPRPTLWSY